MFLERESYKLKLKLDNKKELVNGLLRWQSVKPQCKIIHNRDKNAVQNMLYIVENMLYIVETIYKSLKRLTIFTRTPP